jgi:hypothetical protein
MWYLIRGDTHERRQSSLSVDGKEVKKCVFRDLNESIQHLFF